MTIIQLREHVTERLQKNVKRKWSMHSDTGARRWNTYRGGQR